MKDKNIIPIYPHELEMALYHALRTPEELNFRGVIVHDGICGVGKTTEIFEHINNTIKLESKENKILYVGQFLSELHRVAGTTPEENSKSQIPERDNKGKIIYESKRLFSGKFVHPEPKSNKLDNLKLLLSKGKDIVITHQLFNKLDFECLDFIRQQRYHLILDEEPNTVELIEDKYAIRFGNSKSKINLKQSEISSLIKLGIISVEKNILKWCDTELQRYKDLKTDIDIGRVIQYNVVSKENQESIYLWKQIPEVFTAFKTVHVLTYMFHKSLLKGYFDIHKIPYFFVNRTEEEILKEEKIKDYHAKIHLHNFTDRLLPDLGHEKLSGAWYDVYCEQVKNGAKNELKAKLETFFKNPVPGETISPKIEEKMWTVYKSSRSKLKGRGYTKAFLAFNTRATNEHREVKKLAFMLNLFPNPIIINYFKMNNCSIGYDEYAVSTLIQWIFRSSLRDGKDIHLLLPSTRMRELLNNWMMEFKDIYEDPREFIKSYPVLPSGWEVGKEETDLEEYLRFRQPGLLHIPNILSILLKTLSKE